MIEEVTNPLGSVLAVALLAGPLAVASVLACWGYLGLARRHGWGQQIRSDGPRTHLQKQGTPSLGGVVFLVLFSIVGAVVGLWCDTPGLFVLTGVLVAGLGLGLVGLLDDAAKLVGHKSTGVKARFRIVAQFFLAAAAVTLIGHGHRLAGYELSTSWIGLEGLGELERWILQVLAVVGCANAVNFTDGVDGLAAGTVALASAAVGVMALLLSKGVWDICGPVFYVMASLAGFCLGFLVWNWHPAKMFMGDVGSMVLGGTLGAAAVALRLELILLILGLIFVVETLSVIGQIVSFRLTGRRILKMAPLHHHLELSGWSEVRIVLTAYVFQAVLSAMSVGLVVWSMGGDVGL